MLIFGELPVHFLTIISQIKLAICLRIDVRVATLCVNVPVRNLKPLYSQRNIKCSESLVFPIYTKTSNAIQQLVRLGGFFIFINKKTKVIRKNQLIINLLHVLFVSVEINYLLLILILKQRFKKLMTFYLKLKRGGGGTGEAVAKQTYNFSNTFHNQ